MLTQKRLNLSKRQNRMRENMSAGEKKLGHSSRGFLEGDGSGAVLLEWDENI